MGRPDAGTSGVGHTGYGTAGTRVPASTRYDPRTATVTVLGRA